MVSSSNGDVSRYFTGLCIQQPMFNIDCDKVLLAYTFLTVVLAVQIIHPIIK